MTDFIMKIIPEPTPGTATILVLDKKGKHAIIIGAGEDSYICGTCGNVVCERVQKDQVQGIVFKCPNCGSFNLSP